MKKTFDYKGAKEEGYSDEEIKKYLSEKHPSFDFDSAVKEGYDLGEVSEYLQERSEPSKLRSKLSAFPKGVLKTGSKVNPFFISALPEKTKKKVLEEVLPTRKEDEILERAGELAPYVAIGPEGWASKGLSLAGSTLAGQIAKEGGAGELGQGAAEILGGGLTSLLSGAPKAIASKRILPKSSDKELVSFLRNKGLSEEQITPIIQSPSKLAALSKVALKYDKDSPILQSTKGSLGKVYEDIFSRGEHKALTGKGLENFTEELHKTIENLPPFYRRAAKQEVEDLFAEPITYTSLARFKDGINRVMGESGRHGRKGVIGKLKGPTDRAMHHVDPLLFKEEILMDKAYSKYKSFFKKMTAKDEDTFFKLGKVAPTAAAFLTLNFFALPKLAVAGAVTPAAAKKLLTNPRFQRVHAKMWQAFKEGRVKTVVKLSSILEKQLSEASRTKSQSTISQEDRQ